MPISFLMILIITTFAHGGTTRGSHQFPMTSESAREGRDDICTDLFGAACMDVNGKLKHQSREKEDSEAIIQHVRRARDAAAKTMGFKDFDDALRAKMKDSGIALLDRPEPIAWSALKREISTPPYSKAGSKIYTAVADCEKEVAEIKKIGLEKDSPEKAAQSSEKYSAFLKKYKEQNIRLFAKDLTLFLSDQIGDKCRKIKGQPDLYRQDDNVTIFNTCENITQLRQQAVEIYRLEGTPEYMALAEKFVRLHFLPEPQEKVSADAGAKSPEKKLEDRVTDDYYTIFRYCAEFSNVAESVGAKIFDEFVQDVQKNKASVDILVDSFYGERQKALVTEMVKESRAELQQVVSQFVRDPEERRKIFEDSDSLNLRWLEKPEDSRYEKKGNVPLTLKANPDTSIYMQSERDDLETLMSDPSLSFFTTFNANYRSATSLGKDRDHQRINIMPRMINTFERNPLGYLTVIAHEMGHQIDLNSSKDNGYNLSAEYKDLLACFKEPKSINMHSRQAGEAIADYISSEVLARTLSKLPPDKRRQALMTSMETMCAFEESDSAAHILNCTGTHPAIPLRLGGIFGANPNIRKAIGCEGDSPKFKSCGLKATQLAATPKNSDESSDPIIPSRGAQ